MNPSDFVDILGRLITSLLAAPGKVATAASRKAIRSVVGAWFSQYRSAAIDMLGDEKAVAAVDEQMQVILRLAAQDTLTCAAALRNLRAVQKHFVDFLLVPLSRAYWSRAPQKTAAGRDPDVVARLEALDPDLAQSYEQVVLDLDGDARVSYRGTAGELREVITGVLHVLAPTTDVQATEWYREARRSGARKEPTPTRPERVRFILRARSAGDSATEAAETFMFSVEERLGSVVQATYKRGSAATHGGTERAEVIQLLQYSNALLRELLPPARR